jgi:protein SCO1/2
MFVKDHVMSRTVRWVFAGVAILVVAGLAGLFLYMRQPAYAFHGGEYLPPQPAPPLDLMDQHNEPFSLADQAGNVTLIYFGYTTCPDLCPTTLSDFAVVKDELGEMADRVRFVLATFNPERDTPDRLQQYLDFFDPDFIGIWGDEAQTEQVLRDYGVSINRVEYPDSATGYLIDHTALIYVIDAEGRLRLSYPYGTAPADIAADVRHLLES